VVFAASSNGLMLRAASTAGYQIPGLNPNPNSQASSYAWYSGVGVLNRAVPIHLRANRLLLLC
jgi:hypothetical protein